MSRPASEQMLKFIEDNPGCTSMFISESLHKKIETVRRLLQFFIKHELVNVVERKVGRGSRTKYYTRSAIPLSQIKVFDSRESASKPVPSYYRVEVDLAINNNKAFDLSTVAEILPDFIRDSIHNTDRNPYYAFAY